MQRRDLIRQIFFRRPSEKAPIYPSPEEEKVAIPEVEDGPDQFHSKWHLFPDMQWTGEDLWAKRQQDFCIRNGALECLVHAPHRMVHLLTHQCTDEAKSFSAEITFRFLNPTSEGDEKNVAGFRLGIKGIYDDYRSAIITGKGINAGITRSGHLFIGETISEIRINESIITDSIRLVIVVTAQTSGEHFAKLSALDHSGNTVGSIRTNKYGAHDWKGNIALLSHFKSSKENKDQPTISITKFMVRGDKLNFAPHQSLGAIYFVQHTIDDGILKLAAQLAPINLTNDKLHLLVSDGETWKKIASSKINPETNLAKFHIENWDAKNSHSFRVAYHLELQNGNKKDYTWEGEIGAQI